MKAKLLLLLLLISSYTFAQWSQVGATQFTDSASDAAITFNSSGAPYVVYSNATDGDKPYVKMFDGTNWVSVGTGSVSNNLAKLSAISINPVTNQPWIVYESSNGYLYAHSFDGTSWTDESNNLSTAVPTPIVDKTPLHLFFDYLNRPTIMLTTLITSVGSPYNQVLKVRIEASGWVQHAFTNNLASYNAAYFDRKNQVAYAHVGFSGGYTSNIKKYSESGPLIFDSGTMYQTVFSNVSTIDNYWVGDDTFTTSPNIHFGDGSNMAIPQPLNTVNNRDKILKLVKSDVLDRLFLIFSDVSQNLSFQKFENSAQTWSNLPSPGINTTAGFILDMEINTTNENPYLLYSDAGKISVKKYAVDFCLPVNVQVSNISITTADLTWNAPVTSTTNWEIALVPQGQPLSNGTFYSSTTNSYSFTGLAPGSPYDVYVRALCSGSFSDWTTPVAFLTVDAPIFVDLNATAGALDGSSWADAYTNIQDAIDNANTGGEIWVAQGTYQPTTTNTNPRKATYKVDKILKIYGGFQGNETLRSQRDAVANVTILSGDLNNDDNSNIDKTEATRSENAYHIISLKGNYNAGTIIDGFTITGANANGSLNHVAGAAGYDDRNGSAIYVNPDGANRKVSATISNCIIEKNTAVRSGVTATYAPSAATNTYSKVDFESTIIRNNASDWAILNYVGSGTYGNRRYGDIINCLIHNNKNTATATEVVLTAGSTTASTSSTPIVGINIINTTIANNTTTNGKVVKFIGIDVPSKIDNSIIYNNGGTALFQINGANNITASNSIIEGAHYAATDVDPKFNNIGSQDYTLDASSPAIDAGNNSLLPASITKDVVGNDRIFNTTIDMGALEYFTTVVSYDLTVSKIGSGFVTPTVGTHSYNDGTVVSLTASPATGWIFDKWSGDVTTTNSSETITINANKSVTAEFKQIQHTLTVNTVGNGTVTRSVQPVNGTYTYGTGVTLTAVPAAGYQFSGWSGASTQASLSTVVIMDADKTVTANFSQIQHELRIFENDGVVTPNIGTLVGGLYTYTVGTVVEITAVANSGFVFDHFAIIDSSGTTNSTANPLTITMNEYIIVEAFYTATYELTTSVIGSGTVSPSGTTAHNDGAIVGITATPAAGWVFDGWSGDASGTTNPINITMDADKTVTANFSLIQYELTIIDNDGVATPNTGTLVGGTYHYTSGTVVEIAAVANTGFAFEHFTITDSNGTTNSSTNPLSITITENMVVEAFYNATYNLTTNVVGSGSVSPNGTTAHTDGAVVGITATPAAGWVFDGWSGDASGTTNPINITMDADKTVTANFSLIQHELTIINTNGVSTPDSGTLSGGVYTYASGTAVEITAVASTNYSFDHFDITDSNGTITSATNPLTITMTDDMTVEAYYTTTAAVNDTINFNFKIYPNPVKNVLNIDLTETIDKVEIFNLLGQKIIENTTTQINVSNLKQGVYIVKISADGLIATKRFIKK